MKFKVPNVRLSYPSLFQHAVFGGESTGKYEATFLLNKDEHAEQIAEIKAEIARMIKEDLKSKLPSDKICLKDGDETGKDSYANCYIVKTSTKKRPLTIDRSKRPVVEEDNVFYGGCYVNAIFSLWSMNNSYGKRINAQLDAVQFVKDGDPLGDSGVSISEFDGFGSEDDDLPF